EPLPKEQWFIDVGPLKEKAIEQVKNDEIHVHPKRFKKQLIQILENFIDWNVSRQIVWGIQIPAYRCVNSTSPLRRHIGGPHVERASDLPEGGFVKDLPFEGSTLNQSLRHGLGGGMLGNNSTWFVSVQPPKKCQICGECAFVQDEDTFDTWFSSSQWPFATLKSVSPSATQPLSNSVAQHVKTATSYFDYFYPTTVMETGYDILRAWVSRMIMVGYFETKDIPFQHIFLHGMVRDPKGQKMSKSKGNVINPLDMIEKYGADALRSALIFGTKEGGDVVLSEDKIVAMRNFCNKVWNIGRFIEMSQQNTTSPTPFVESDSTSGHPHVKRALRLPEGGSVKDLPYEGSTLNQSLRHGLGGGMSDELTKEFKEVQKQYHAHFKKFEFAKAFDLMYEFLWHRYADYYIEQLKECMQNGNIDASQYMVKVYYSCLQMLHPYIPFVTEVIWKSFHGEDSSIMDSRFET
ncbi:MAG: class I tRNA ligase family protein, partial [Candidatus Roizmanbacteria bacterium]|nr:class I tRNA ligase family protein [Candidatus Roizmanbacteria bacterium]